MEDSRLPLNKEYKLVHFRQRYDWDCGISCILMVVSALSREYIVNHFDEIQEGFGSSTWTIDLCYILKRFNVTHKYLTKTIGVDPKYIEHSYYTPIIERDQERVKLRFEQAEAKGINVEKKTVKFDAIIRHLSKYGPVILLTNAALLTCDNCKRKDEQKQSPSRYLGHYVVICGYDLIKRKVLYRNPAQDDHVCVTSVDAMDRARKAYGTDEDVIFIYYRSKSWNF
ncbi:protein GUCD1 isoform X2 [Condylostylus longicornis]|uniref:protein GUCD1 isoform X2 n=1 Tax=Condylostylus longicornis TaxID=2530218 RepID=UPI00244DD29E|nr:protein GUCD1 isoform X2 [Condylostylus longicornis]